MQIVTEEQVVAREYAVLTKALLSFQFCTGFLERTDELVTLLH